MIKSAIAALHPFVLGSSSCPDALLLLRIWGFNSGVVSSGAAAACTASNLRRIGGVGKLMVNDEHQLVNSSDRGFCDYAFITFFYNYRKLV